MYKNIPTAISTKVCSLILISDKIKLILTYYM